jgi:hypothetical protein
MYLVQENRQKKLSHPRERGGSANQGKVIYKVISYSIENLPEKELLP